MSLSTAEMLLGPAQSVSSDAQLFLAHRGLCLCEMLLAASRGQADHNDLHHAHREQGEHSSEKQPWPRPARGCEEGHWRTLRAALDELQRN